jgi:TgpA N-terminal domain/Transglutaminase-like superfamily
VTTRGLRRAIFWGTPVVGALATFLAAAPMWHAFPTATIVVLSLIAAVVPSAIVVWASRTRRPIAWSAGISAVALVVALLAVVLREPLGFGDVVRGIGEGPARILSESLPIAAPRWVEAVPFVLTWLTGAVSTELLLRTRRSGPAWATLTWVTSYVVAYLLTVSQGTSQLGWACALLVVIGVLVFARQWAVGFERAGSPEVTADEQTPDDVPMRALVEGALSLVAVTVLCGLVVPNLPGLSGSPVVPKRTPTQRSDAPVVPTSTVAELRGEGSGAPIFDFSADQPTDGYVSFADLDVYNGDTWDFDTTFHPTGGAVPSAAAAPPAGSGPAALDPPRTVVQHYRVVSAPPFEWMPYLERPVQVGGIAVAADADSGMVVPQQPLQAGQSYTVTSEVTPLTLASLRGRELDLPLASSPDANDTEVPLDLQKELKLILLDLESDTSTSTPTATLTYLQSLESAFVHDFSQISTTSSGVGTSFAEIADYTLARRRGTPEQYATVFALLARYLNIPARVVTGFRVLGPGSGETTPGRVYALTAREAWTWVEVPVAGLGWVVVDPTPASVRPPVVPSYAAPTTTTTVPLPDVATNQAGAGHALARPVRHRTAPGGSSPWLVVLVAVAAAGLLFVAQFRLRAALRRRRRRRGDPARRVVGAWAESLDLLSELKVADVPALTSTEVGDVVGDRYGPEARDHVGQIGALADRAIFSTSARFTDADADACWRAYADLRRESFSGLAPAQRAVALLH